MKKIIVGILIAFPLIGHAEHVYKCKTSDGLIVYSDLPCKAAAQKPITVKENTIDQSQLRNRADYANALPKPIDNSPTGAKISVVPGPVANTSPSPSSIADQTTSSANNNTGNAAITTQPWK